MVANSAHRSYSCAILMVLSLVHAVFMPIDLLAYPSVSAMLILSLGVPHGALDIEIIKHRRGATGLRDLSRILFSYVLLACVVLGAWFTWPSMALAIFLGLSAYHFGGDWRPKMGEALSAVVGATLLAAPALLHRDQVTLVFSWLAPTDGATRISIALQMAAPVLLLGSGVVALAMAVTTGWRDCDFLVLLAAAVVLPPISFFLIYFCFYHSLSHLVAARTELMTHPPRALIQAAAPYALVAIGGTLSGALLFANSHAGPQLLSAVFIALAALTVPHMALIDGTAVSRKEANCKPPLAPTG